MGVKGIPFDKANELSSCDILRTKFRGGRTGTVGPPFTGALANSVKKGEN